MPRLRILLFSALVACAAYGEQLLTNPGFETSSGWTCPDYWAGALEPAIGPGEFHSGQAAGRLTATDKGGRVWGRIHGAVVPAAPGLAYRFSVWAKGSGQLKLGVIQYRPNADGKLSYLFPWQAQATALTDAWTELRYEFEAGADDVLRYAVAIELEGHGAVALLDDASLETRRDVEGGLEVSRSYVMAGADQPVELRVTAKGADGAPLSTPLRIVRSSAAGATLEAVELAGQGTVRVVAGGVGERRTVTLTAPRLGVAVPVTIDAVSPDQLAAYRAAAEQVALDPGGEHWLILGDSLTDPGRGITWPDIVGFWLDETHDAQLTIRNAAVGGDYITRVLQRLDGDPKTYRAAAYDDLFVPRPSRAFILLGHNDTKLSSGSGFRESVVPPSQAVEQYTDLLRRLRGQGVQRVTLFSNTSSVYEICKDRADKLVAEGKAASLFGMPEAMEAWNAAMRTIAGAQDCRYIDLYEPTRTHRHKPSLFVADGVHLAPAGHEFIALLALQGLGSR